MCSSDLSRAGVLSVSSTLQEYIDGACSISCPLWPFIERGAFFFRQISSDRSGQHELSMDWRPHTKLVLYTGVTAFYSSSRIDWQEIMSWYPIDGTIFVVRSIEEQGPVDMTYTIVSSWK